MIADQNKGTGFRGLLNYLWYGYRHKPRDPKHVHNLGGNMAGRDPRELAHEFSVWRQLRPDVERVVYHTSLSIHPDERLSDERWRTVAAWYLKEMGFANTSWMMVRHSDTDHAHVHLVASRIRWDGTVVSDRFDYDRSARIVKKIEREFGLKRGAHTPAEARAKAVRSPSNKTFHKTIKDRKPRVNMFMQRCILAAATNRPTMTAFLNRLTAYGITAKPNQAKTGRITGISFAYRGVAIKGSDLGKAFSWQGLQRHLRVRYDPIRDAAALANPPQARPPKPSPTRHNRSRAKAVPMASLLKPFARKPQAKMDVSSALQSQIAAVNKALFSVQTKRRQKEEAEEREIERGFG